MPFLFPDDPDPAGQAAACLTCHAAGTGCLVDLRDGGASKGRTTKFQWAQQRIMDCTLDGFVPGTDSDPAPDRSFKDYRAQAYTNVRRAGEVNFPGSFSWTAAQVGKIDGDIYEMMVAAALWNAAAAWNQYMDTGNWTSAVFSCPPGAVVTPTRKVAIVKMARGADTTLLLSPEARAEYQAFSRGLSEQDMELRLSTPDILGVRIPHPMPEGYSPFMSPVGSLSKSWQDKLELAWRGIQGTLESRHFLFAVAVKTSTRADRLYQALFEANALKYILGYVLRGPAIRFWAFLETFAGADVVGRYKAANMTSLLGSGARSRAIDETYLALRPRDTAQKVLDSLPGFIL